MNHFSHIVARRSATRLIGASAFALALALPVIAWSTAMLAVQSISLSPVDVTTGGTTTGTVQLDAPAGSKLTNVTLTSGNTSLATVPSSLNFSQFVQSRPFSVQTVSGAFGCTNITARLGTTLPKATQIAVHPVATTGGSPVHLTLNSAAVVGGSTTSARVTVFGAPLGTHAVQLSSNNSVATVPASVNVTMAETEIGNIGGANFNIQTNSSGGVTLCPIITARLGNNHSRRLLKVLSIGG